MSQSECFQDELNLVNKGETIKRGKLSNLCPFLDEEKMLRVGGRLQLSNFDFEKKHPIVLGAKHPLTELIVRAEHVRLLHAGPQMVLSSLRERYWPMRGRNLVRKVVNQCVKCARVQPSSVELQMGYLPKSRVTPQPPFHITGMDYAGPFNLKNAQGRGNKSYKGYVCLFVCFTTRAIHLEVVSTLSTEGFIATFRRFVARRGKPLRVYSDNGKNFVGAESELRELSNFLCKNNEQLERQICDEGIQWSFIPAYSPHFGGLWEAGVKSVKYHLKRAIGNLVLNYEQFTTILNQIEATLNSRPLTPLSSNPSDLDVLTPAHFLIGRRLTSLPDPSVIEIPENRLSQFQKLQQIQQLFWCRWSKDYIAELQKRVKWKTSKAHLQKGMLVVIKEDNRPPLCWRMGRVLSLHYGKDGIARVATLRTIDGVIKRSFSKICPLPVDTGSDQ